MKDRLKRLCVLVRAKIGFIDDKAGKPVGINDHIGRRPVAAIYTSSGGFAPAATDCNSYILLAELAVPDSVLGLVKSEIDDF
jgi:hypothetical protein